MESPEQSNTQEQFQSKPNPQLIDINLTFGDDGGQETLAELKLHLFSMISTKVGDQREKFLVQIQSKEEEKDDALLIFKFEVQSGRERQSFQFIEKGLDQDEQDKNISEMQKLFRRPKTAGRIEMKEGKGYIYVIYRFYHEKFNDEQYRGINEILNSKIDLDFTVDAIIKGKTESSRRSFTSIKSDFVKLKLQSQKITMKDFLDFVQKTDGVEQEITQNDFYKLLKNLQMAKFNLKFNSLRKVLAYYNRIMNFENDMELKDINSKQRVSPLSSKGIFRNYVSAKFYLGTKLGIKAELTYKNEEIMMRLVAKIVNMVSGL